MGDASLLLGFIGVAVIAYLIPGPDWLMVMRGATDGAWNGVRTGLGTQAGLLLHGALATVGISALIAAAPAALIAIQVVGALYLLYLAITGIRASAANDTVTNVGWRQALLTNLTNPKAIIFFVAVAPQFVDTTRPVWPQMLTLTVVDVAVGILWWTALAAALAPIVTRVGTRRITIFASTALGVVAIGLLVFTAAEHL
jgi:threonine/homoserine/homoserine lactone efflux protein